MNRMKELEEKLIETESRVKDNDILRAKERAEQEISKEKTVFDGALAMDVLNQDEYNASIAVARKKSDKF